MSKVCKITKKRPMSGYHVSHAKNHVKRRFMPNLQSKRFWDPVKQRFVRMLVSAKAIKLIDKIGFTAAMERLQDK